ncbi:hypothetical protein WOLCODRAFT_117037 [Wolfiporia cocos MD-104 SS10]|uniref:Heme oxygenase-like protein n=1 Tax=Wolfiporia cocos (strain MD-104) TaxID=742152 RepID=A0A2H3JNB8_WOLCO|nr:hypothetical protein WOLCODRAFT_117037 [Wolfiporia cocos MD-104 SS10]
MDYSLPLATLLRTSTAAAHNAVEKTQGAGWLARGELDQDEYARLLMMLWHVYDAIERAYDEHQSHPVLSHTYNSPLLARAPLLSADISYYLDTDESTWRSHPAHVALMASPPSALSRYLARIQDIAQSADPSPLLAHAYVRYLGDLSGGQVIRNRIVKSYGLSDGRGVAFYEFKSLGGTGPATIGDMKKIKEWYRGSMNSSVGDNQALKAAIVEEANVAFELNGGLFAALKAPRLSVSTTPALPLLGEPSTPVISSIDDKAVEESGKVVFEQSEPEKTYQLSSVLAVVAAMSLAHFLLVVGGFTGDRGLAKLQALKDWLSF